MAELGTTTCCALNGEVGAVPSAVTTESRRDCRRLEKWMRSMGYYFMEVGTGGVRGYLHGVG
jgi:hypothetical protein